MYSDPTISYHRIIVFEKPSIGPPPLNAVHNVLFIAHPQFHRQLMLYRYDLATYVRSLGGGWANSLTMRVKQVDSVVTQYAVRICLRQTN